MDDVISRQAAIEAIEEMQIPIMRSEFSDEQLIFTGMSEALAAIKELPSAHPEQRWIPCSERLPKPYEYCLWTTAEDGRVVYHHWDGSLSKYTAWMPLPEPWRGEEDERSQRN